MSDESSDVTWQRQLDASLEQLGFVDSLSEGVVVFDAGGVVLYCNEAAAQIGNRHVADMVGDSLFGPDMVFSYEDGTPIPLEDHPVAKTLATGVGATSTVVGIDLPDVTRRFVSATTTPIFLGEEVVGLVATLDDISDRLKEQKQLRLALEVSRLLTSVVDETDFLQGVCDALVDVGGYTMARISEPSSRDPFLVTTLFGSGNASALDGRRISWTEIDTLEVGHVGRLALAGDTVVVREFPSDLASPAWNDFAARCDLSSLVVVPFHFQGQTVALSVYSAHEDTFDDATVTRLEEISREVDFGIQYVTSVRQLATALKGTVSALSHMTESRDPYTSGHQSHVGELGAKIARHMGQDGLMVELIRQSGELHDVGKISIPAEILTYPGRLTELQFEMVKTHTTVGYEILSRASLPWPIAEVALQHHERLDGSGYPQGLMGDAISLPARIIAVADVVEAMSQHRPYRAGLGIDRALAEVRDAAGVLFDRDVVAACLALFDQEYSFDATASDAHNVGDGSEVPR